VRTKRGLTLRNLAEISGLSINSISLIEHGRISPTIATLQKLATGLGVTLADFVEEESAKEVIFLEREGRHRARSVEVLIESLGTGLSDQSIEPLLIMLEPGANSGPDPIVHLGHELVFCLEGQLTYEICGDPYLLHPEDSLLFEARLPHRWRNEQAYPARALLILQSPGRRREALDQHF
jgi:XRE family transcriptional regulator, regulator of sulfur utilization